MAMAPKTCRTKPFKPSIPDPIPFRCSRWRQAKLSLGANFSVKGLCSGLARVIFLVVKFARPLLHPEKTMEKYWRSCTVSPALGLPGANVFLPGANVLLALGFALGLPQKVGTAATQKKHKIGLHGVNIYGFEVLFVSKFKIKESDFPLIRVGEELGMTWNINQSERKCSFQGNMFGLATKRPNYFENFAYCTYNLMFKNFRLVKIERSSKQLQTEIFNVQCIPLWKQQQQQIQMVFKTLCRSMSKLTCSLKFH